MNKMYIICEKEIFGWGSENGGFGYLPIKGFASKENADKECQQMNKNKKDHTIEYIVLMIPTE